MFKSFLPKICAIPAAAIPLALLNVFGHVPPINGRVQRQPPAIARYCQVVTIVIPTVASLVATYFKYKFPLKNKKQVDQISVGVGKHMLNASASEPITGISYKLEKFTEEELPGAYLLDSFRGEKIIENLLKDPINTTRKNVKRTFLNVLLSFLSIITSVIASYVTTSMDICPNGKESCFRMLENPKYSFFPVLSIIWFGTSLTCVAFTLLMWKAAKVSFFVLLIFFLFNFFKIGRIFTHFLVLVLVFLVLSCSFLFLLFFVVLQPFHLFSFNISSWKSEYHHERSCLKY